MKKIILWGLCIILVIPILSSCEKENTETLIDVIVTVQAEKFNTSSESDLKNLVKVVSKEKIKNFEDIELIKATDAEGEFYAVTAKVLNQKDQIISLVIPLNKATQKENNAGYSVSCTMKCISETTYIQCKQNIVERCKQQSCGCSKPKDDVGKCSSSVVFGN